MSMGGGDRRVKGCRVGGYGLCEQEGSVGKEGGVVWVRGDV